MTGTAYRLVGGISRPRSHPRDPDLLVLSERQREALRAIGVDRAMTDRALANSVGANHGTLASLLRLGLVKSIQVGGRDPIFYLTDSGSQIVRFPQTDDPGEDRSASEPQARSLQRKENPMPATPTQSPPAAKPTMKPLYDELVGAVKKLVSGKAETKAAYARINAKSGRTVAYINLPTTKGVRVEIPRAGASGYDVIKVTSSDDVPKVIKAVEEFNVKADEFAAKKAEEKAAAAAPSA